MQVARSGKVTDPDNPPTKTPKRVALVAYDQMKDKMAEWVKHSVSSPSRKANGTSLSRA